MVTTVRFKLATVGAFAFFALIASCCAFEENSDTIRQSSDEQMDFELPRERSNLFLRSKILNGQDDDAVNQVQTLLRRDHMNMTYYKDRNGRICILCKWGILPCCEPNTCQKHRIRFNECVENNTR
ncbi:unnamed protein product [Adineta ricciae]|uniref:Uncharacterized protein n=1 Tax=Adineta ricciae TaxID=249248 RepID=A0A814AXT2_ADIRI|nr:unnamed protein product [Adineta ricciae]CAF0918706.1 unnamed protein product [Adineta ricciae]